MIDKGTKATPPTQIPSEVIEAMRYLLENSLDEYNVTFPETQRAITVLRAWLAQQRGQG